MPESQRYIEQHRSIVLNQPHVWQATDWRSAWQLPDSIHHNDPFIRVWFPIPRLIPEGEIEPYSDPDEKYLPLPEPLDHRQVSYGWKADMLVKRMIPDNQLSRLLYRPLMQLLYAAARKYYAKESPEYDPNDDEPTIFENFAAIAESQSIGLAFDRMYRNISPGLQRLAGSYDYLAEFAGKGVIDLDISFISDNNPRFILDLWDEVRAGLDKPLNYLTSRGELCYLGKNYQLMEKRNSDDGNCYFQGWRLTKEIADDGTELIILQAGIFSALGEFSSEEDLILEKNSFSIELSTLPSTFEYKKSANSRAGAGASLVDRKFRLLLRSLSYKQTKLVAYEHSWNWESEVHRYGRSKNLLFANAEIFKYRGSVIEVVVRALRQTTAKVGAFEINNENGVADEFEHKIDTSYWSEIRPESWTSYIVHNLAAAAHLSPLVFGVNLIPNSRLDDLPKETSEGSLRRKLAEHGIDYTLSLGQLWPEIFTNLSNEQIINFLTALPDQKKYITEYLSDQDKFEKTGDITELKMEHQGIYYIINALRDAGVELPDFGRNYLRQFLYVFRHPDDMEAEQLNILESQLVS